MDEFFFRSSQKFEILKFQADFFASRTKELLHNYSHASKILFEQIYNSEKIEFFKENTKDFVNFFVDATKELQNLPFDPKRLYLYLIKLLEGGRWSKREISIACASFMLGGLIGAAVACRIQRNAGNTRYMEAIQISHYLGTEAVTVVEDAPAPFECGDHDVLINVKAASVHLIDAQICCGYGKTLRQILRKLRNKEAHFPVILGRDCTGVVTDLGRKVHRLEIGDEVWVTVPFWSQGTLSQTVLVTENWVARKPKNVGFEGACSIPYAGSVALSILTDAELDANTAQEKQLKFLVQDGCTPVGCILLQILRSWNVRVTTTCFKRAIPVAKALGATEIITINENDDEDGSISDVTRVIYKELELRNELFDVIVLTRLDCDGGGGGVMENFAIFTEFLTKNGKILSSVPPALLTDEFGFFARFFLQKFLQLRHFAEYIFGLSYTEYDEAHLCYATLERLTELVEEGILQTVVDKVFYPKDIEIALNYIKSVQSIGSSVITFR